MISVPYTLREFGELGVGEKHCILPNNVVRLTRSAVIEDGSNEEHNGANEKSKNKSSKGAEYRKIGDR